ncbi:hypothetical protein U1Q18_029226 [Sarracenia purpurea var. burkii]
MRQERDSPDKICIIPPEGTFESGQICIVPNSVSARVMGDAVCRDQRHRGGAGHDAQGRRWGGAGHWVCSGAVTSCSGGGLWCCTWSTSGGVVLDCGGLPEKSTRDLSTSCFSLTSSSSPSHESGRRRR